MHSKPHQHFLAVVPNPYDLDTSCGPWTENEVIWREMWAYRRDPVSRILPRIVKCRQQHV